MGELKMAKKAAEKSAKELSEMLLNPRKNGFFKVTDEKIEKQISSAKATRHF